MKLLFAKMQGAGNDFVVLDGTRTPLLLDPAQIRALADRHFGIGADQVLVVEQPTIEGVDFRYRIYNQDGGEVEHCGNGARCFVKYVVEQGLTDKRTITVQVQKGRTTLTLQDNGEVTVDMGAPELRPEHVPFDHRDLQARAIGSDLAWPLAIGPGGPGGPGGQSEETAQDIRWISVISMGNPHAVQVVDDITVAAVGQEGPAIESHWRFPARVNAGFMQIVDRQRIRLRVYERGAGETLACGTGACAAVVAGIRRGLLDSPVSVQTNGGVLTIGWEGLQDPAAPVTMTGPAVTVFRGEITLPLTPHA